MPLTCCPHFPRDGIIRSILRPEDGRGTGLPGRQMLDAAIPTLEGLQEPIAARLAEVQGDLKAMVEADFGAVNEVSDYLLSARGKLSASDPRPALQRGGRTAGAGGSSTWPRSSS